MTNTIPPITDPLGKHWRQPPTDRILIDDTHAVMSMNTFKALAEYSTTIPNGVYPGKMWKANPCADVWNLRWFGMDEQWPKSCTNNQRIILIT